VKASIWISSPTSHRPILIWSIAYLAYALHNVVKIKLFPRMLEPLPWEEIQSYFDDLAKDLLIRAAPEE
jgi:hypothetical protein